MTEHRRIRNGEDNLDTCTACAWASWDTAPSFAEHVELMAAVDAEQEGWASYAAEQERHAERLGAVVDLAERWQEVLAEVLADSPSSILTDRSVITLDGCLRELRRALDIASPADDHKVSA